MVVLVVSVMMDANFLESKQCGGGKSTPKNHPPKIQNAQNLKKILMKIFFLTREKITRKRRAGECGEFRDLAINC